MHSPTEANTHHESRVPATGERIAELYARVLGVDDVSAHDDFFVLGGTSLSAMQLLDLIEAELGVAVPVKSFYRATGVTELAHEVQSQIENPAGGQ